MRIKEFYVLGGGGEKKKIKIKRAILNDLYLVHHCIEKSYPESLTNVFACQIKQENIKEGRKCSKEAQCFRRGGVN